MTKGQARELLARAFAALEPGARANLWKAKEAKELILCGITGTWMFAYKGVG